MIRGGSRFARPIIMYKFPYGGNRLTIYGKRVMKFIFENVNIYIYKEHVLNS